jgi:hypothetical protein
MTVTRSVKAFLKRSRLLREANARLRAGKLRRDLQRLRRHYEGLAREHSVSINTIDVPRMVRQRLAARGIHPTPREPEDLGIFWAGTALDQDRSGFLQALETFGHVTCMVDDRGAYGFRSLSPRQPGALFDPELRALNSRLLLEQVEAANARRPVEVLMGQMWANFVSPDALRTVQRWGLATVNVSMDDRLPEHWRTIGQIELGGMGLRSGLDLVLTTTRECVLWYAALGCPAIYWPLASDPTHFVGDPQAKRDIDVCFVGSRYGIRGRVVNALLAAGIEVQAFGPGWPRGPVSASATASLFARSKIVLGIGTVGHTSDIYTIKLRDFDAPMSGALYLTHRNPDLLELYEEDREIACYSTPEECATVARRYLSDDATRIRVATAGAARAHRDHTWRGRIMQALATIGYVAESAPL